MVHRHARFRFYAELNDCLSKSRQYQAFGYSFSGRPAIKDSIEALGVPHTEVDLILVNGKAVDFGYHLQDGDRVSVYPVFERLDISPLQKLRKQPLRNPRFVLDVHLGKLARKLRMLGFNTLYRNDYDDPQIVYLSLRDRRIILTRDRGILKTRAVSHGYLVRSLLPQEQLTEVIRQFDLCTRIHPFQRCMACNGELEGVEKEEVLPRLLPKTARYYHEFYRCLDCDKIYWKGTHFDRMLDDIRKLKQHLAV